MSKLSINSIDRLQSYLDEEVTVIANELDTDSEKLLTAFQGLGQRGLLAIRPSKELETR